MSDTKDPLSPWQLPAFDPFEPVELSEQAAAVNAAHLRACSEARMIDYGMSRSDAACLRERVGRGAGWAETTTMLALRDRSIADGARGRHPVTAAAFFVHEAACWNFQQVVEVQDGPERTATYQKMVDAFAEAQAIDWKLPAHVTVPTSVGNVAAWMIPPSAAGEPVVIQFGGLTGWGLAFNRSALALAERGIGSVLLELPGQGLTRMEHQTYLDEQFAASVISVVDWIQANWVSKRVGILGNSMGGLFAARAAAAEPRLAACCINGAPIDPIPMFERYPRQWHLAAAMCPPAARGADSVKSFWRGLAFDQRSALPGDLLVTHGAADILVSREQHAAFLGSWERASMVEWPGAEHCVFNFAEERDALVCDWFAHQLRE